jgi:hypothetical protein
VSEDLLAAAHILTDRGDAFDRDSLLPGDILPPESRVGAVCLMLRGMAVECLLKGLWLRHGNELVRDGRYIGIPGAGDHNLVQIASAVAFAVSVEEKDVLRRLSHFIEYGGRYPIPRNADKLKLTRSPGGGSSAATTWTSPQDQQVLEGIVVRLDSLLSGAA